MFESVEEVQQRFRDARYIANRRISTVVFLAARMGRPVLIEGPAGVGKTELAKTLADVTSRQLIRLPVLRGARRGQGPLRVEVRQAAALHAAPARAYR
jgi:MoxR-like ATPase